MGLRHTPYYNPQHCCHDNRVQRSVYDLVNYTNSHYPEEKSLEGGRDVGILED